MAFNLNSSSRRKYVSAARQASAATRYGLPPAFYLTDPKRTPNPTQTASRLPWGWGLIYRHFGSENRFNTADHLASIARRKHLRFLIAADPELALAVGADGVHWPYTQATRSRRWASRFSLMTASAHTPGELRQAARLPIQGILFSTVFESKSPSAQAPCGAARFRQLARASETPVYALGGVQPETADRLKPHGFAAIEGIENVFGT